MKFRSVIILCGGRGTRLGGLGKKTAKALVKIQGKPILWYILKLLKRNKFNHFILPIGYKGSQIKGYFSKNKEFKNYNIEITNTGLNSSIANRIYSVKDQIKSENFLILNGDAIFNFDLEKIYNNHKKNNIKMTFISFGVMANFGTIGVKKGKVVDFRRNFTFDYAKSKNKKNLKAFVYSGISIMNIKSLKKNFKNFKNFEKELYPWIINKFKTNVETPLGFWHSVDNMKDINVANNPLSEESKYSKIKMLKKIYQKFTT